MVNKKSWKEFRETGLFWWINMILHTFGWALVVVVATEEDDGHEKGDIIDAYPARVGFRGFDVDSNTEGYIKVSKYIQTNANDLLKESEE